jgi:hypothetical protein
MVKLKYDSNMKNPKGPCVIVIHANWCGHCKTLMPKFENEIVTSHDFNSELEGLVTLGSVEETYYNKEKFGEIDGYPTIRYICFTQYGKPLRSIDLPANTPHETKDIIAWINDAVKNDILSDIENKSKKLKHSKKRMNGGRKNKKSRTMRKKYKNSKRHKNNGINNVLSG